MRSDSLWRSSSAPVHDRACPRRTHRAAPRAAARRSRAALRPPRTVGRRAARRCARPGRPRARHRRPSAASTRQPPIRPSARATSQQAGASRVHPHVIAASSSEPGTSVAAAMKNAAEEKSPGTSTSLEPQALGAATRSRRPPRCAARRPPRRASARCGRGSASRSTTVVSPSASSPASSTQDFTCALATGSSYADAVQLGALDRPAAAGGPRGTRRVAPMRRSGCRDAVDRAAADALVAVERPASPAAARQASPGRIRSSVPALPDVDRSAPVGAAQPDATSSMSTCRVRAVRTAARSERRIASSVAAVSARAQVVADGGRSLAHRADASPPGGRSTCPAAA